MTDERDPPPPIDPADSEAVEAVEGDESVEGAESVEGDESVEGFEGSEDDIRDLLRGALEKDEREVPDVLRGVQRKLRQRSKGKFYSDGWSTEKNPPIATYLVTSLVMLAIVLAAWAVLSPLSGAPAGVAPPEPVNVVPGPQHRTP